MINHKVQYRLLDRNIRYSYLDGIAFSFMLGATFPYTGLYLLRFQGSPEMVNLISSLQPVITSVITLLAASYVNNITNKKPVAIKYGLAMRLSVLLIALVPLLPESWRAWMFFGLWLMVFIPWGINGLLWTPMTCNMIPENMQGRFFGTRNALTGITGLLGTFLTGIILARLPFAPAFTMIFFISFAGTLLSLFFFTRQIEPLKRSPQTRKLPPPKFSWSDLNLKANFLTFRDPVYGSLFTLCCLTLFIFHIGFSMAGPLYILRQIQELKFDNGTVGAVATIQSLAALFGSYLGGHASGRFGYRYVLLFSTLFLVIPPLIWAFSSQLTVLFLAAALWGLTGNAYMICFFFMVLAVSPDENRSRFIAMNTVVGNLAGAIGPLFGIGLMNLPKVGIHGALIFSSIIMLSGAAISYRLARRGSF
ncbi:MAG: MFS transporter [Firmicutes bacterium]|nr:MFS transporter [Bacillota bacterium]